MASSDYSLEKARAYEKKKETLTLVHLFLSPAILLAAAVTPFSAWLKTTASGLVSNDYAVAAVYFTFFTLYTLIFDAPLAFYSGYALEKRYELSNHTVLTWTLDFLKRSVLSLAFLVCLILGMYALIWHFPETWWIFAWAGFATVSYVLGKLFPVVIVPLFYKYSPVPDEALRARILALASRYGMPLENVYSLNLSRTTKKANAAFMGMGKTKRVVLSDTLLENFTADEIETVVAHELGHFKHGDIWKQLVLGMVSSFAGFWLVSRFLNPAAESLGYQGAGDIAALPLIFLIFYVFYLILMPLQNGFSRMLERAADLFALEAFPHKDIFISCMNKLCKVNLADPEPNPVFEWLFHDHPAIAKRIRLAENWSKGK